MRVQIENYVSVRPDYVSIVTQAWRFLLAKDQRVGGETAKGRHTHTHTHYVINMCCNGII